MAGDLIRLPLVKRPVLCRSCCPTAPRKTRVGPDPNMQKSMLFTGSAALPSCQLMGRLGVNRFTGTGNYSATSNNMKLVHWPLMGGLLHLVQRGVTGRGRSPPRPHLVPSPYCCIVIHCSAVLMCPLQG